MNRQKFRCLTEPRSEQIASGRDSVHYVQPKGFGPSNDTTLVAGARSIKKAGDLFYRLCQMDTVKSIISVSQETGGNFRSCRC